MGHQISCCSAGPPWNFRWPSQFTAQWSCYYLDGPAVVCTNVYWLLRWVGNDRWEGTDPTGKLTAWVNATCPSSPFSVTLSYGYTVNAGACVGGASGEHVSGCSAPNTDTLGPLSHGLPPACCNHPNGSLCEFMVYLGPLVMGALPPPTFPPCFGVKPDECVPCGGGSGGFVQGSGGFVQGGGIGTGGGAGGGGRTGSRKKAVWVGDSARGGGILGSIVGGSRDKECCPEKDCGLYSELLPYHWPPRRSVPCWFILVHAPFMCKSIAVNEQMRILMKALKPIWVVVIGSFLTTAMMIVYYYLIICPMEYIYPFIVIIATTSVILWSIVALVTRRMG